MDQEPIVGHGLDKAGRGLFALALRALEREDKVTFMRREAAIPSQVCTHHTAWFAAGPQNKIRYNAVALSECLVAPQQSPVSNLD